MNIPPPSLDIHQATGFDGVLIDSWLTFAMLPDGGEAQPMPQLDQAMALQRDLRQMGITEIHIEGTSPLGLSSGGYGLEGYLGGGPEEQAMAMKLFERIHGREYGLYRYVADTIPEAGSYYRALASKGVIGIFNLDALHTYVITRCPDFVDPVGVGVEDIQAIAGRWDEQSTDAEWDQRFDLNHNQRVDLADVMGVVAALGDTCTLVGGRLVCREGLFMAIGAEFHATFPTGY